MDIASIVGMLMGISLLILSILIAPGATFKGFIDYPSIMVVVGGAISAVLISFPLRSILGTFKVFKNVFFNRQESFSELIEQIVSLAETARRALLSNAYVAPAIAPLTMSSRFMSPLGSYE